MAMNTRKWGTLGHPGAYSPKAYPDFLAIQYVFKINLVAIIIFKDLFI